MSRQAAPPRFARALLRHVLPRAERDGAVADLDEKFAHYVASTMGPRAARRWYRRQVLGALDPRLWMVGGATPLGDLAPPTKGRSSMVSNLVHDVRFGARMLAKSPVLTLVVIVTLAIGLGFNGAIYSMANTIVLNDISVDEPHRVLYLDSDNLSQSRESLFVSYLDYLDFVDANTTFESLAAAYRINASISDGIEAPTRYLGASVEPTIFDVLRIEPVLGRRLTDADAGAGAERVALIGHGVWQARYGGDEGVLGRVIQVNGAPTTVIGVLPPELQRTPFGPNLWLAIRPADEMESARDRRFIRPMGRLRPGATQADARAELDAIAARLAAEYPDTNEGVGAVVQTYGEAYTDPGNRTIVFVLLGAVGFLLLIACANVANLLVARAAQRRREVVIRAALGAGRWRLVRQLLIESLTLSLMAGLAGIALTIWGARGLENAIAAAVPPDWWDFSIRPSVYGFVLLLSLATSVVFGLMPALHATRSDVGEALKDGGRGSASGRSRRLTGTMVVAQVALSLVLLAGAGVMVRSTLNILDVRWSIDPRDVLTARISLPSPSYPEPENLVAFEHELRTRFQGMPGIEQVAVASHVPPNGGFTVSAELEGAPVADGSPAATFIQIIATPEYFELAGARAARGRLFDRTDTLSSPPVIVIDGSAAERYWPGEDPVGKRLRWIGETETRWIEIVGVVPDLRQQLGMDAFEDINPVVYTPLGQEPLRGLHLFVRSPADTEALTQLVRDEVAAVNANLPLFDVATLNEVINERTAGWRIVSVLFGLLGGIALFLASVGIYSVMAFAVGNRQQEIGIRMALGARERGIVALVARTSLVQVGVGLTLGLVGAYFLNQLIAIFMYDVSPTDPLTFVAVLLLLGGTAVVAGVVPARRASRVDPAVALRWE